MITGRGGKEREPKKTRFVFPQYLASVNLRKVEREGLMYFTLRKLSTFLYLRYKKLYCFGVKLSETE